MRKTFLEMIEVVAAAIVLTALLGLLTGAGLVGTIMTICDNLILVAIVLMLDDLFFRANRYRQSMNRNYVIQILLEVVAVSGFAAMKNATGVVQNYLGLAGTLAGGIGALVWYVKVYSYDVETDEELADRALRKMVKEFRKRDSLTAADMASDLERISAYHFLDGQLEAGYDFSDPFDPVGVPVVEMTNQSLIGDAQKYILQCAEAWLERFESKKKKKTDKE